MIRLSRYKDVFSISILEDFFVDFISYFRNFDFEILNIDNAVLFFKSDKSRIRIENETSVEIFISESDFTSLKEMLYSYQESEKFFPLDISLEQLGFDILPNSIKDVVIECGEFPPPDSV